jgi:hypothetical protein
VAVNQAPEKQRRDLNQGGCEVTEANPVDHLTVLPKLPDLDLILERVATIRADIMNLERETKKA